MEEVGYLSADFVLVTIIDRGIDFPRFTICVVWLLSSIGGTGMNEMMKPDELLELTKQDRMRIFQEVRALDELAQVVHRKALDGDNAAGHLELPRRRVLRTEPSTPALMRSEVLLLGGPKRPCAARCGAHDALSARTAYYSVTR
jgi:hypothetical protein